MVQNALPIMFQIGEYKINAYHDPELASSVLEILLRFDQALGAFMASSLIFKLIALLNMYVQMSLDLPGLPFSFGNPFLGPAIT